MIFKAALIGPGLNFSSSFLRKLGETINQSELLRSSLDFPFGTIQIL